MRKVEALIPTRFGTGAATIPGATQVLRELDSSNSRWAVVSSSTRGLIEAWFHKFGLTLPRVVVASEDVEFGKPNPRCYELACNQLGVTPASVLVVEDAPSGVMAGKAAGCHVVGVTTTHAAEELYAAGAHCVVKDLRSIHISHEDVSVSGITVSING